MDTDRQTDRQTDTHTGPIVLHGDKNMGIRTDASRPTFLQVYLGSLHDLAAAVYSVIFVSVLG